MTIGTMWTGIQPMRFARAIRGAVRPRAASGTSALCFFLLAPSLVIAADERLVDQPPFDQVVLDETNNNAVLNVALLELPDRRVPAAPTGSLTVELADDPTQRFEVAWRNIAEVRLFEDMLLAEATRLTKEGKFDEAFDYFSRLLAEYPSRLGVNDAANEYLRRNALALYQAGELDRSMAVLSSLYERSPNSPGLGSAVDSVCGKMLEDQLRKQDFAGARAVLDLWQNQFSALKSSAAVAWEQRFSTAAQRQIVEGKRLVEQQDYAAARKAIGRARDIWPEHPEARELLAEIQRKNPSIVVGVLEGSPRKPVRRIDDWASMRASRLVEPTLSELVDFSSEGGVYTSPYGEWVPDESGLRLSLKLTPPAKRTTDDFPSADFLARFLLRMTDPTQPEYQPDLAVLLDGVSIEGDEWVHLDWVRPHVRPEALLQVPLTRPVVDDDGRSSRVPFSAPLFEIQDSEPASLTFAATENSPRRRWLQSVVEQTMPDDDAAVTALLRGEIDVLERVPPWQLERLRAARDIRVDSYKLPTIHALIPNPAKQLPAMREFRRALCFGIQRERDVGRIILGGTSLPGYEVISGPFPPGISFSDPLRYAYNSQLEPRPFEPRLAAILATVAWSNILDPKGKGGVELVQLPTMVLAHPADPVARTVCQTIKQQLDQSGIPIELMEFTADELLAGSVDYDLRYAELAVWEPVADARLLLGPDGPAGDVGSSYLYASLRQLDEASNWKDVRARLSEIHEIAHHDLPLIPLWQTVNYFAYRSAVRGIGRSPISLYQHVDDWEIADSATGSRASRNP